MASILETIFPLGDLSLRERLALSVCAFVNERKLPKAAQALFHRQVGRRWIGAALSRQLRVEGLEPLRALRPPAGVLLVANHRSLFDQYAITAVLLAAKIPWLERCYFPVRSNFFYETFTGLAINLVVGGGAMYPPIFRDRARAGRNKLALERLTQLLHEPGTMVGMHPEGTRGKGPDPYQLLPAQPGVGQVALHSGATVLPAWIGGLSNDFLGQVAANFRRDVRRTAPVIIVFGEPFPAAELAEGPPRPALYKEAADRMLAKVRALGERERELRYSKG